MSDLTFVMAIFNPDDEADRKKKKKARVVVEGARLVPKLQPKFIIYDNTEPVKQVTNTLQLDRNNHLKEDTITNHREVRQIQFSHIVLLCMYLLV